MSAATLGREMRVLCEYSQRDRCIKQISNSWVQHAASLVRSRGYRERRQRILIGGHHIVGEYIRACDSSGGGGQLPAPLALATTKAYRERHGVPGLPPSIPHASIDEKCVKYITREPAPEGILAEIPRRRNAEVQLHQDSTHGPRFLVLTRPSLPGNMGTLVRTALALAWTAMVVIGEGADATSYEAVRASRGAVLRLPILDCQDWSAFAGFLERRQLLAIIAEPSPAGEAAIPSRLVAPNIRLAGGDLVEGRLRGALGIALVVGNESRGLEGIPEILRRQSIAASISTAGVDSLNVAVAGGILMNALSVWRADGRQADPDTGTGHAVDRLIARCSQSLHGTALQ